MSESDNFTQSGEDRLGDILRSDDHSGVDPWEVASVLAAVPSGWAKLDGEWVQLREVKSDSLLVTAWCEV